VAVEREVGLRPPTSRGSQPGCERTIAEHAEPVRESVPVTSGGSELRGEGSGDG
jgi:hypothetical protein